MNTARLMLLIREGREPTKLVQAHEPAACAAACREPAASVRYSTPQEKTWVGVTSTITESDSSRAASSGYCGYLR
jgi:hypothetical protein